MAYDLRLPAALKNEGWKVKISNWESVEPPHVTIIRKTTRWRFGLREHDFLEGEPDPSVVSRALIEYIEKTDTYTLLCNEWNRAYPNNPVSGGDDD